MFLIRVQKYRQSNGKLYPKQSKTFGKSCREPKNRHLNQNFTRSNIKLVATMAKSLRCLYNFLSRRRLKSNCQSWYKKVCGKLDTTQKENLALVPLAGEKTFSLLIGFVLRRATKSPPIPVYFVQNISLANYRKLIK